MHKIIIPSPNTSNSRVATLQVLVLNAIFLFAHVCWFCAVDDGGSSVRSAVSSLFGYVVT